MEAPERQPEQQPELEPGLEPEPAAEPEPKREPELAPERQPGQQSEREREREQEQEQEQEREQEQEQEAELQLWIEYRNGGAEAREQLVSRYLPLAKRLATGLFARRSVDAVEFGDYLHLAYVGLLEAIQRYQAGGEARFTTFASHRIRGAILNGVAKMTETGERIGYLRRAHRDRAESVLAGTAGPDGSLAALLDVVVAVALTCQLDEIAGQAAEPTAASDPYASRNYEDTQRRLRRALQALPPRERRIVDLHYFQQMGFDEIAGLLAVTKGRVSQLHRRALELIREALGRARLAEFY